MYIDLKGKMGQTCCVTGDKDERQEFEIDNKVLVDLKGQQEAVAEGSAEEVEFSEINDEQVVQGAASSSLNSFVTGGEESEESDGHLQVAHQNRTTMVVP